MNIFYEDDLASYLATSLARAKQYIEKQSTEYLLNVDVDEFVQHVVDEIPPPTLDILFDEASVTTSERQIAARDHPGGFMRDSDWVAKRQVVTYHLPFRGDSGVLRCTPNPHVMNATEVRVSENEREIRFDVVDFYNDAEKLKAAIDWPLRVIKEQFEHVEDNLASYAASYPETVRGLVESRRNELKKRTDAIALLGIPVKVKDSFPGTFAVPVSRKMVFAPPSPTKKPDPHPTLKDAVYEDILSAITDMGRAMERHPSTYRNKDEESLRDHFIMVLEPRYEGETTGETFSKTGKTDIMIRWQKSVVFIAECKYWDGKKSFTDAVDQLLDYLTWRDSKAAVVVFVKNDDISKVLAEIQKATLGHPNYVSTLEPRNDDWLPFTFHINGDENRHLTLTVLVFHMPDVRPTRFQSD